jgi:xanthine/CO dehydrogenase XdhC/CoxF family maturation factor
VTSKQLQNAFERWSEQGKPLVLASVYETEGSTYSKAGAQMLITGDGDFQGMLSGGCLEGDLAERARAVLESGAPQSVTYDLGQNDEELWGLGVGCDGLMRIFLQPVTPDNQYEPFATMCKAYAGLSDQVAATVLESGIDKVAAGSSLVTVDGEVAFSDIERRRPVRRCSSGRREPAALPSMLARQTSCFQYCGRHRGFWYLVQVSMRSLSCGWQVNLAGGLRCRITGRLMSNPETSRQQSRCIVCRSPS